MMKMGFKVGSGLGKDGEGRKEPVPLNEVKMDKKGVGKNMRERQQRQQVRNLVDQRAKSKCFS